MLQKIDIKFSSDDILKALTNIHLSEDSEDFMHKIEINAPSGNWFYDPWHLKTEFQNTNLISLFDQLGPVGQARIVMIKPGCNYTAHADIDDRYHINLQGEHSYLIDLDNTKMYPTLVDNCCYLMDTSRIHTAVNFGYLDRIQLVIRKLLDRNQLQNPTHVKIKAIDAPYNLRYLFDQTFSIWLNKANKKKIIDNFKPITDKEIDLDLEREYLEELKNVSLNCGFKVEINHD